MTLVVSEAPRLPLQKTLIVEVTGEITTKPETNQTGALKAATAAIQPF